MNIDDLVQQLNTKAGLSDVMAKQVIAIVLEYIKKQLPPSLAAPFEEFLKGNLNTGAFGKILEGIGGLFGTEDAKPDDGAKKA